MSLIPTLIIKNKDKHRIATGSKAQAERLVYDCLNMLLKHYPEHPWRVSMSGDYSVIGILLDNVHGNYGMILHTLDVQSDPDLKCVIRAGGEMLERSFQLRSKFREDPEKLDLSGCPTKRFVDKDITFKKVLT